MLVGEASGKEVVARNVGHETSSGFRGHGSPLEGSGCRSKLAIELGGQALCGRRRGETAADEFVGVRHDVA